MDLFVGFQLWNESMKDEASLERSGSGDYFRKSEWQREF